MHKNSKDVPKIIRLYIIYILRYAYILRCSLSHVILPLGAKVAACHVLPPVRYPLSRCAFDTEPCTISFRFFQLGVLCGHGPYAKTGAYFAQKLRAQGPTSKINAWADWKCSLRLVWLSTRKGQAGTSQISSLLLSTVCTCPSTILGRSLRGTYHSMVKRPRRYPKLYGPGTLIQITDLL